MMLKSLIKPTKQTIIRYSAQLQPVQVLPQLNIRCFSTAQDPQSEESKSQKQENNPNPQQRQQQQPQQQAKPSGGMFSKNKGQQQQQQQQHQPQRGQQQQQRHGQQHQLQQQQQQRQPQHMGQQQPDVPLPQGWIKYDIAKKTYINLEEQREKEAKQSEEELQKIINEFKNIKDWNKDTIVNFVNALAKDPSIPMSDGVSISQLKDTRAKEYESLNPQLYENFETARQNVGQFRSADAKLEWKRDKFDLEQAKFIQKYLLDLKRKGEAIDPQVNLYFYNLQVYKDLNFNARKYIQILGSNEFGAYVESVLNQKLKLDHNNQFQAFITDLFVNGIDTSATGRVRCLPLERFVFLTLQYALIFNLHRLNDPAFYKEMPEVKTMFARELEANFHLKNINEHPQYLKLIENEDFMLAFNFVSFAKNHNFFASIDQYMKEFTKISLKFMPEEFVTRLESTLGKEIVIVDKTKSVMDEYVNNNIDTNVAIHHNVLSQPSFQFDPRAVKMQHIENQQQLEIQLQKTRKVRDLIQVIAGHREPELQAVVMNNSQEFIKILNDLDNIPLLLGDQIKMNNYIELDQLMKTTLALNEETKKIIAERYGFQGIQLDNLEDIYNPLITGIGSMLETRNYLLQNGMTADFADTLARRYITKLEGLTQDNERYNRKASAHLCSLMDLFDSKKDASKALNALQRANFSQIHLNYLTWAEYQKQIVEQQINNQLYRNQAIKSTPINFSSLKFQQKAQVRPMQAVRGFSSQNKLSKDQQKEALYDEKFLDKNEPAKEKKGKFFQFIQEVDKLDQQPDIQAAAKKDYDLTELDISFDRVTTNIVKKPQTESGEQVPEPTAVPLEEVKPKLSEHEQKIQDERDKLIFEAKKFYNYNFFKNFAFSGPDHLQMSQRSLEEFIMNTDNTKDIQLLIIAMVTQAYELNSLIPNIEMVFYKMFTSPITTKEQRQDRDDGDNILVGNIFSEKGVSLTYFGYKSLFETLMLFPKKKHFKKAVSHFLKYEKKENIDPKLINMIIKIGIDQQYPVFLGQTMKYMLQNGYQVPKRSFSQFVLFLERCKGYEEDAKRFIFLTSETENLDFSYEIIRPIFLRNMANKTGNDVLKLFEQFRKNIKLNKSYKVVSANDKAEILKTKKREFYDGLLKDLLDKKAYALAQIVYSEKMREKFDITINDQLTGLQIFASQKKIDEFSDLYTRLLSDKDFNVELTQSVCEAIALNLIEFDSDKEKLRRLDMLEKLVKRVMTQQIGFNAKFFDSVIYIYTESQQWRQIIEILQFVNPSNCQPELKTLNYLKKNLLYCFEPQTRSQLKEQIERMENNFFSKEQIGLNKAENQEKRDEVTKGDKKWKDASNMREIIRGKKNADLKAGKPDQEE